MASIMRSEPEGREIDLNLFRNLLTSRSLLKDPGEMENGDLSLILHAQLCEEIFIDPFPEGFILFDLMSSLSEGATTRTAQGTDGKTFLLSESQVSGGHQEVSIVIDRFDRVTAAAEFRNVNDLDAESFSHFSG